MAITTQARQPARPDTLAGHLAALEIDTRLLGMTAALVVIWIGFHLTTDYTFLTARNLWNLAVQTAVVGIVATGMVLVIVTRNIDLSVGSVLGVLGMIMAVVQVEMLPQLLGLGHPLIWVLALLAGILCGAAVGALQGFWIAYMRVPSFIVTLAGLLIWRGCAWWITSGRTVAPMDQAFQVLGGGITGSIGALWSWIVGLAATAIVIAGLLRDRQRRRQYGFPTRPLWAECAVAGIAAVTILGFVLVMNSYYQPERTVASALVDRLAGELAEAGGPAALPPATQEMVAAFPQEAQALVADLPGSARQLTGILEGWEGLPRIARGIPVPVLIMLGIALAVSFIARQTRLGRYIFAIGGNPDAADLAGVNTRRVLLTVFIMMGVLAAIAGAVQTARLNSGANATGTLLELYAIAAAVVGGTSLAGGVGTIAGALLGAFVMQSLISGMGLMGVETTIQQIVVGLVLVAAVYIDTVYQRRRK